MPITYPDVIVIHDTDSDHGESRPLLEYTTHNVDDSPNSENGSAISDNNDDDVVLEVPRPAVSPHAHANIRQGRGIQNRTNWSDAHPQSSGGNTLVDFDDGIWETQPPPARVFLPRPDLHLPDIDIEADMRHWYPDIGQTLEIDRRLDEEHKTYGYDEVQEIPLPPRLARPGAQTTRIGTENGNSQEQQYTTRKPRTDENILEQLDLPHWEVFANTNAELVNLADSTLRPQNPPQPIVIDSDSASESQPLTQSIVIGCGQSSASVQNAEEKFFTSVLEVFPDIAHDYVRLHYKSRDPGASQMDDTAYLELFISRALEDPNWPKERDKRQELKRKREQIEAGDDSKQWEKIEPGMMTASYKAQAYKTLCQTFPRVPCIHVASVLEERKTVFKGYLELAAQEEAYAAQMGQGRQYKRVRARSTKIDLEQSSPENIRIAKEISAARGKLLVDTAHRESEEANEKLARETNLMGECNVCFDNFPLNRMVNCNGWIPHFSCQGCFRSYVNGQIGQSRGKLTCMDTSGCEATWTHKILDDVLDAKLLARLELLQFQDNIRTAGIQVAECPFCEYKEEYPPVEENREFQCRNPDCEQISCRLCKQTSHTPKSCEEVAKDIKINTRHAVEEAMTQALVRKCNRCKQPFVKLSGCNKVTCTACGHTQCYICSDSVTDYKHFDRQGGKCKLYDNTEERHANEVDAAEKEVLARLRSEYPNLGDEDLKIRLSERVQEEEKQRIQVAAQQHALQNRNAPYFPGLIPPQRLANFNVVERPAWVMQHRELIRGGPNQRPPAHHLFPPMGPMPMNARPFPEFYQGQFLPYQPPAPPPQNPIAPPNMVPPLGPVPQNLPMVNYGQYPNYQAYGNPNPIGPMHNYAQPLPVPFYGYPPAVLDEAGQPRILPG